MKITFLGTPDYVQPIKETLAKNFELVDNPQDADLTVVASYGKILTQEELSAAKFGSINVHPSLLPKYRGATPIQSAILNGDKISGITIIKMDEEVDHGPILYQEEMTFEDTDTFESLSKKTFLRASEILPQLINNYLSGKITPQIQDHSQATFCSRLTKESGYFDINNPPAPEVLNRMIRAYHPWPGVWTRWNGKIVKFLPEGKMQMEGKKPLPLKDFLNGYANFPKNLISL